YKESMAYDANGNILNYLRNGNSDELQMDSLTYKYNRDGNGMLVNNKLNQVRDQVTAYKYAVDIDNQQTVNYSYDKTGNLVADDAENISDIQWTVYGKIKSITKTAGPGIGYGYNAGGNRTTKVLTGSEDTDKTYYIRDAQGNVLAVYQQKNSDAIKWREQHLYGSSRLGMLQWDTIVPPTPPVVINTPVYDSMLAGSTTYELSNHLGNVLSTISDKKIGVVTNGQVNHYIAAVLSQNDYYPGGMDMPGRSYSNNNQYRYGFNGKENDNEVKGEGNQQDYGMRIYDPRLGRFLSVDPISKDYPELTPYQFASNRPIDGIDLDGLEFGWAQTMWDKAKSGYETSIKTINDAYTQSKPYLKAFGNGLNEVARNLAPVRPADDKDPKSWKEAMDNIKSIPSNLYNLPTKLKSVYENGTDEQKIEASVGLVGTVLGAVKGKASSVNAFQAGFKLPKFSLAFRDYFTKGVHAYIGKGEALYYLDAAGEIGVKATGKNLSKKDITKIVKEGTEALKDEGFRNDMIKKIDDSLGLGDAKSFKDGVQKLEKMKDAIKNYGSNK
ncbi:MAG: hypothetical protein H0U44_07385, partial [Flavisolibacter sp.]|nr:hypothetical protein [Flavisolibacter sp.]